MHAHARRQLLNIEIPEEVFQGVSERHFDFGSVDAEHGRIIGRSEGPIIPVRTRAEILDADTIGIDPYGLRERFGEGFQESLQFLGLVCEEIFPEVFPEAVVDIGFVFFHFSKDFMDCRDF